MKYKKNILFINTGLIWGGVEGWHFKTAKALKDRGYKVFVLAKNDTPFQRRCEKAGIHVDTIKKIKDYSFLNPLRIWRLVNYLKKKKINTMFFCQSSHFKLASIAGSIAGVNNIVYRRALANPINNHIYNRIAMRRFITHFMGISKTTISKSFEKLPQSIVEDVNIKLVYNGVKYEEFATPEINNNLRKEFNIKDDEILIANIGRLGKQKAQDDLINALTYLKEKYTNFKMLFIGTGDYRSKYEKLVNEFSLENHVVFTGFREDIPAVLNQIDFLVHSALYEGCPWIILETMAAGKPIVSVDIPSVSELLDDGVNGYLSERDKYSFGKTILKMIKNDKRAELGKKSYQKYKDNYTFEIMINKIEKYFLN
jgi:glycosyltransferase involved in cell wall biosynthesis